MGRDVTIVGGGIAGLSCAWRLQAGGLDFQLLEAQELTGGNVRTDRVEGFLLERGPHTFMPSADDIFTLATEVGIADQIVSSHKASKKRFIVRGGRLHKVFTGPFSFLGSRLLSFRGKLKLMGEAFRTKQRGNPSDTAAQFFTRRFGPEAARIMAGAFISGVYAGDPQRLSAPAAFPLFWRFEQESGSMIRGALKQRKQRKLARKNSPEKNEKRLRGLFSFKEGLGQLSAAVAARLGNNCRTSATVRAIEIQGDDFLIKTDGGEQRSSNLVLAVPPSEAGRLLGKLDPGLGDLIASIPMAPVAVAYMGHNQRSGAVPDGFGFLAPRGEGVRTLGVLFPSRLFSERTPEGGDLFTGYIGGMTDPGALSLEDPELVEQVADDLQRLTGHSTQPSFQKVARYPEAIPQFTMGHLDRMSEIKSRVEKIPGLYLAGNYLKGVGMKDAVGSGFEAAADLLSDREKPQ